MGLVPFWARAEKDSHAAKPKSARVIVCGNEKGGSGKSTLSVHIAIALLKAGHRVATIDLDTRQKSFSRFFENRKEWSEKTNIQLEMPYHICLDRAEGGLVLANEDQESRDLLQHIGEIERNHDFIIIDTPGSDTYLQRLAHMVADTLVTPINDSFVDFDVLAKINPQTFEIVSISQYAEAVRQARRERRRADDGLIDWIVVRNRLSSILSRNEARVHRCVEKLSAELGFRVANGVSERVIFRELFPFGLTVLDNAKNESLGSKPNPSHVSAREEIKHLVEALMIVPKTTGGRSTDYKESAIPLGSSPN